MTACSLVASNPLRFKMPVVRGKTPREAITFNEVRPRHDATSHSKRMAAGVRSAVRSAGQTVVLSRSEIAVVPVRLDLRPLTKGITDEAHENSKADGCKNPIGHDLDLCLIFQAMTLPYGGTTLCFQPVEIAISGRF